MASGLEELQKMNTSSSNIKSSQDTVYTEIKSASYDRNIDDGFFNQIKFVGMNTDNDSIKAMREGIIKYVSDVKEALKALNDAESAKKAFGPQVASAVETYVTAMKDALNAIVSNLEKFAGDIDVVAAKYRAKGLSIIDDVNSIEESISTAASKNTYTYTTRSN